MQPNPNVITFRTARGNVYQLIRTTPISVQEACDQLKINLQEISHPWWLGTQEKEYIQFWLNGKEIKSDTLVEPGSSVIILGPCHHDP